jgi:V/A-type H+-transporting ATPase subunit I
MREKAPQAFVDARKPETGETPPTKLKNPRLMRPFEQIVNIVDIPKYGGWDPTPIVALSFAFFYGLMIGDVLYGIFLALVARFLLPSFVDDRYDEGFKEFQRLIYLCACSAIVIGALNGGWMGNIYTLFGIKDMALSPLVKRLMGDPLTFVIMAVIIGFIHVNLAHLLALIKGIGDRNIGAVLNRVGLFLTQFALPGLLRGVLNVQIPLIPVSAYPYLNYVMYAGIVLVIVSNYIMNKGTGFFLWIFDITGLFGDVVSYARLAGVGLAGSYLGQSFNLIVVLFGKIFPGVVGAIVGTVAGIALFLIGHTFNLILSGMGCFVHSLRLCFVEFLTKFYDGGGQEYAPFRIRRRPVVAVAVKS